VTTMAEAALAAQTTDSLSSLTLASGLVLVSWWKALALLVPLIPWAWFVSKVLDKHAARFYLPRETFNTIHLVVGLAAFVGALLLPVPGIAGFFAAFGTVVLVLGADVLIFVFIHNRDEQVPEQHQLKFDMSNMKEAREAKAAAKKQGKVELTIIGPDKRTLTPPEDDSPEFEIRAMSERVFLAGMDMRASQIDIQPISKDGTYGVLTLVDGVKNTVEKLPPQAAVKVIDFWKSVAKLSVEDRRRKQSGDASIGRDEWTKKVRISTSGGPGGQRLTMLIEPESAVRFSFDDLGFSEQQAEIVKDMVNSRGGLIVLAAPPDNGLTSLTYGMIRQHDAYTSIVNTIELEPQDAIEGVNQTVWDPTADGPDHATTVRSILRRDPDVVAVAEVVSPDTIREVIRADLERSRAYIGVRAGSALEAIGGVVQAADDAEQVGKVLKGVIACRLLRRLCSNCKVAYQPSPEMLKKLGLPADRVKQLCKKSGQVLIKNRPEVCPVCKGTGYMGQAAMFEVFPIEQEERAAIASKNWNALRTEMRKRQLPTLQTAALRLAVQGVTSLEEIARVTTPPKQKPSGGTKRPAKAPA